MVWTTVKVMSRREDRLIQVTADHEHEEQLLNLFSDPNAVEVTRQNLFKLSDTVFFIINISLSLSLSTYIHMCMYANAMVMAIQKY